MRSARALLLAAACTGLTGVGCQRGDPGKAAGPAASSGPAVGAAGVLGTIQGVVRVPGSLAPPQGGQHEVPTGGTQEFVFGEQGGGVAFVVVADGQSRVVHRGQVGQAYQEVGDVVLSRDGRRHAYAARVGGTWRMVVDGKEGVPCDRVGEPVFSQEGAHLAYPAKRGGRWHLIVDEQVGEGTRTRILGPEFSGDSSSIAFLEAAEEGDTAERGRLVVSDLALKARTVAGEGIASFRLDAARTTAAAVSVDGEQARVLALALARPGEVRRSPVYQGADGLALGADGASLAYLAHRDGRDLVVLDGREQQLPPGADVLGGLVIRPDRKAVAALVGIGEAVSLQEFFVGGRRPEQAYREAAEPVYAASGSLLAYAASRAAQWFLVVNGQEGPPFDRIVGPRFSPDGKKLVYRARQEGRRFVVVADLNGRTIRQHPAYDQVFPVQFAPDGKSVAYGVKDGQVLAWKVEPL